MQGHPYRSSMSNLMMSNNRAVPMAASPPYGSKTFPPPSMTPDRVTSPGPSSPSESGSYMTTSLDSLAAKLTVSPQTIPESQKVDHSLDGAIDHAVSPLMSPNYESNNPISRNSSTRSLRATGRASRIPGMGSGSRRSSRRSGDPNQMSASPAAAFLSSWNNRESTSEPAPIEPKPDDEGQSIGLNNEYIIGRSIARGGFGVVKEVHSFDPRTGDSIIRAVKIVHKQGPGQDDDASDRAQQELEHEVSVWRHLRHKHILSLHAVYELDYATFCVMDLNVGGSLFDMVAKQRKQAAATGCSKGLEGVFAKRYAHQLACALRYLHEDIRVCHRDVKLENCLVDLSGPDAATEGGNLRLCDFGLADFLSGGSMDDQTSDQLDDSTLSLPDRNQVRTTSSVIGTLEYASPRGLTVNRKLFETAGDVWAFGVVVYALCTGDLPFRHAMPSKTIELIMHAEWDSGALRQASAGSEAAMELVRGCLELDIDMRWTIGDVLRSPWFEGCVEETDDRRSIWS
jgi:serine/threonine protein kinase